MSYGVRKLPIGGLSPDVNNALIVAVIISRQNFKIFISKKDVEERGVWNFTLRDSVADTINATLWGSSQFIRNIFQIFKTSDVVEIINPRIVFKQPCTLNVAFSPAVTSPFQLQLQENYSSMSLYAEDDVEYYKDLIYIPTKAPGDFLRLADVYSYGQAMKGEYVNLLVAIRNIGEIRNVKSKRDKKELLCRHITVMDQSHLEFHMTLWNEEIIERSNYWRSRETIIFFADVKLEWDTFRDTTTANINARTVVTESPRTNEATALQKYAKTAPIQPTALLDHFAHNIVDATTISNVMTTAQVLDKAYASNNLSQFTALIYACVTHLNLDGSESMTLYKCSKCLEALDETRSCLNLNCLTISKKDLGNPQISFNLQIHLTDHRGTLYNCRLVSPAADEILGCPIQRYIKMTLEEKTKLKWRLLLARCEARIVVLTTTPERPQPLISILACKPTTIREVASKLPIY